MAAAFPVTKELFEDYLNTKRSEGLSESSVQSYMRRLRQLYEMLPEDKQIRPGTIRELADRMLERGYSPQTVNVLLAAADGLVSHYGHEELRSRSRYEIEDTIRTELSRQEYLWLLSTAKTLGKAKAYFLIKSYVTLGLTPQELSKLTVEALGQGFLPAGNRIVPIPRSFCRELQEFAKGEGIRSGPIFVGRQGKPMHRSSTNELIATVQQNTWIPAEKCTPRCMRKLYLRTQAELESRLRFLMEQEYERMLAEENSLTGWENERMQPRRTTLARTEVGV